LDQGMNPLVFVFYRHTTAALVLIPITFLLERSDCPLARLKLIEFSSHALFRWDLVDVQGKS
jgi:hypothetical protein